jgi:hypothetical protein
VKNVNLSTPEFGFIVATRAALAFGVGLLVSNRLDARKRLNVGRTLIAVGALTTIPAALLLRRSLSSVPSSGRRA